MSPFGTKVCVWLSFGTSCDNVGTMSNVETLSDTVWFTDKTVSRETLLVRLSDCKIHKFISAHNSYNKGLIVNLPKIGNHIIYLPECIVGIEDEDAVDF